jgi:Xaa-Pro aminopeptidase
LNTRVPLDDDRTGAVAEALRVHGVDAIVTSDVGDLAWLTGFAIPHESWPSPLDTPVAAVATRGGATLVVPELFESLSRANVGVTVRTYPTHGLDPNLRVQRPFADALRVAVNDAGLGDRLIAVDSGLPYAGVAVLARVGEIVSAERLLEPARRVKSPQEIEFVRENAVACDRFQDAVREAAHVGRSEAEVFAEARCQVEAAVGRRITILGDLVSGPRTLDGGGPPTARQLADGDAVLCDVAISVNKYWADNCATVCVGRPRNRFREVAARVHEALLASADACQPGASAGDVDRAGRALLASAGLAFGHHLGHGIGASYHELPRIAPGAEMKLEEGMVLCLEPAAFEGTDVGVRLEAVGVVRRDHFEFLSRIPELP